MDLQCGYGDADTVGNLFVYVTGRDLGHDFTLARAERVETLSEHAQGPITLPACPIASKAGFYSLKEVLIAERLGEKLDCTALHRLHGHRHVGVRCDKDDWELPVRDG